MLDAFADLRIEPEEKGERCPEFGSASFSLVPEGIEKDDYDFDVSINDEDKGYLGFEGKNLKIVGKVRTSTGEDGAEKEMDFSAPVDKFKLEAEFIKEDNKEVIEINKSAKKPVVKDFGLELG